MVTQTVEMGMHGGREDVDVWNPGTPVLAATPGGAGEDTAPAALDPLDPFALPGGKPFRPRRPRAQRHAQRTAWLHLRLLPSERIRLTAAAGRAAGYRDTSSWARGTLLAACGGEGLPTPDEGALFELERLRRDLNSGVGSNLNQVTAHANARAKGGEAVDEDALLAAVNAARAALEALRGDLGRVLGPRGRA